MRPFKVRDIFSPCFPKTVPRLLMFKKSELFRTEMLSSGGIMTAPNSRRERHSSSSFVVHADSMISYN